MHMKKVIVIFLLLCSISFGASIAVQLYQYVKAHDYTVAQVNGTTNQQIANVLGLEDDSSFKWGIGKIKRRVVNQMRQDVLDARKIEARDLLRTVFPNCTFQQIGGSGNLYQINLSGDPNDV